ncbi:uncharacterized protein L203_102804 [Cryptococcus depauperatus CBS 7841]|uniref:Uncharacterized protein n=1 Tax=Cryptococcus depauperatus CBS 7841 TaxID=1295531 RepID=A0AAJ8JSH7_9TREE
MPLYKFTEKRLKKRELENELGITDIKDKMREMGQDVLSSDNDLDSEESSDEEDEDEDVVEDEVSAEEDDGIGSGKDDCSEGTVSSRSYSMNSNAPSDRSLSPFPLSPFEALERPIYNHETGLKFCVFCPGRVLKNDHMVEIHLDSGAHKRASKRFETYLLTVSPDSSMDPRRIAKLVLPSALSLRSQVDKSSNKPSKPSAKKKGSLIQGKRSRIEQESQKKVQEKIRQGDREGKGLNRRERRLLAQKLGGLEAISRDKPERLIMNASAIESTKEKKSKITVKEKQPSKKAKIG